MILRSLIKANILEVSLQARSLGGIVFIDVVSRRVFSPSWEDIDLTELSSRLGYLTMSN